MRFKAPNRWTSRTTALLAIALALAALQGAAASTVPSDLGPGARLSELMRQLAQVRHGRANFVEWQYLAVLDRPLESSGQLRYDAPDRLEMRTVLPKPERLVLQAGVVMVTRGGQEYRFALQDHPQLIPFIESVRATLAGDLSSLRQDFDVRFEDKSPAWTLVLVPRESKLMHIVERVEISGSGPSIQSVEIMRTDGDHSVIKIRPLEDH